MKLAIIFFLVLFALPARADPIADCIFDGDCELV
jgi:hypothetical protein